MFALQLYWLLRRRRRLEAAQRRDRGRERVDGARGAIVGQERAIAARGAVARWERDYAARGAAVGQERADRDRRAFVEQKRVHAVGGAVAAQGSINTIRGAVVKQERVRGALVGPERTHAARGIFVEQKRVQVGGGASAEEKKVNAAFVEQEKTSVVHAVFVGQEQGRAGAATGALVGQEQGRVNADLGLSLAPQRFHMHGTSVGYERAHIAPSGAFVEQEQEKVNEVPSAFIGQERLGGSPGEAFVGQERVDGASCGVFASQGQERVDGAPGRIFVGLGQETANTAHDGAFVGMEQETVDVAPEASVGQDTGKQTQGRRKTNGQRRQRVFNTRTTLLGLPEDEVVRRYGLSSVAIMALYEDLKDDLDPLTGRSHAIPGLVKLLSAIHFMASGSFQNTVAVVGGMEQSTFSRCFRQVLQAMTSRVRDFIQFPTQKQQWQDLKGDFCAIAGLPNVIGIIDCMHVALIPPRDREASFRNSKHFHSLNVQVVCDAHMNVLNVVPRFPGSCHDSYVLRHSALFRQFEEGMYGQGWLLGDAGYGCRPWLLTPVPHPKTPEEKRFNEAHMSSHSVIKRTFRMLKSRFKCLDKAAGSLQYCPLKVAEIVLACCILHNVAVRYQVPVDINPDLEEDPLCPPVDIRETTEDGNQVRSSLIVEYFA